MYGVSASRNVENNLIKISIQKQETKYFKYLGLIRWPHASITKPRYDELACEQALRGAMTEGWEKEGELSCNYVSDSTTGNHRGIGDGTFKFQRQSWRGAPESLLQRLMMRQNKSHI